MGSQKGFDHHRHICLAARLRGRQCQVRGHGGDFETKGIAESLGNARLRLDEIRGLSCLLLL